MKTLGISPATIQNNRFTENNRPVTHFLVPKIQQNKPTLASLPNLSLNYFHPSFGRIHPGTGLKLKAFYKGLGLPFLLPHEVWSNKKIFNTIRTFGKDLDELIESRTLNKEKLQEAVDKVIPKRAKNKILIKDFSDLENDLRVQGYSEDDIKTRLSYGAMTIKTFCIPEKVEIYLNFEKAFTNPFSPTWFKAITEHELKHSLSKTFQNIEIMDVYKLSEKGNTRAANNIFMEFEKTFKSFSHLEQTKLTKNNMLRIFGFGKRSIKGLHSHFEKMINKLIKHKKSSGELSIDSDNKALKQLFAYLKHVAKDEKEAYTTEKRYRELYDDRNKATNYELSSLLYGEMEKFFAQKERDCLVHRSKRAKSP